MSNQFEKEAQSILNNAPAPDADADTIKEHSPDNDPGAPRRGRGRPPGSGKGKSKAAKKSESEKTVTLEDCAPAAKAVNTVVFSTACIFTGTKEAWPADEKAEIMDKALARYMEIKNYSAPPEAALFAAYATYIAETVQKPEVKENLVKRFGGIKGKFTWLGKLTGKFKKSNTTKKEN